MERTVNNFNAWLKELEPDARYALTNERREIRRRDQLKMLELAYDAGQKAAFKTVRETSLDARSV